MRFKTLLSFSALFLLPTVARSAATPWQTNKHGQVRLISAYNVAPSTGPIYLGLHFKMMPGWHTYFKDPGDAGYPPKINWQGSSGISQAEILFPAPEHFIAPGNIETIGYENEVVYPIRLDRTSGSVRVVAHLTYLTCGDICIPYKYTFNLDIPAGKAPDVDAASADLIEGYLAKVSQQPEAASIPVPARAPAGGFAILLLAFIGGIILNVMPCVLPVLSIKLLGLLQHSGQARLTVVRNALASAAGILVSFWGLALAAIAARHAGHAIGWGIQFQNPGFVAFLMAVVMLFAFNLWGIFEINLPGIVGRFATSYGYHETLTAHFVSGLFATLLATPCSAPFLGTAMGFALGQPAPMILAIFTAVGTGMALPYFTLAVFPKSIHWLPKPGPWMVGLKKGMSILLLATAAWLGWVLHQQLKPHTTHGSEMSGALAWQSFDEPAIDRYLAQGKSVFVDVTADWCVTCKVNEKLVLQSSEVAGEIQRQGIVLMKADWTNQDPVIADYLKKYNRAGIPFYAFYRPGHPPVLLSELLTVTQVLNALQK